MKRKKTYFMYIIFGIVISLASALYMQDLTKGAGASITGYGLPLPWIERITVVVPDSPSSYLLSWNGLGLLADIGFWTLLIGLILTGYKYRK